MNSITVVISILAVTALLTLYRVIIGPTAWDRIIAVNLISSKVVCIMVVSALLFRRTIYMDVALVYAVIGFVSTIAISKYLEREGRRDK
jgi:multicomponent Na+:H+ antiporter subunit F